MVITQIDGSPSGADDKAEAHSSASVGKTKFIPKGARFVEGQESSGFIWIPLNDLEKNY